MLGLVVSTLLVVYSIQLLLRLLHNRRLARSTGLPYILFPISEQSLFYIVLSEAKAFSYVVNHWLPLWLADYMNASNFKTRWTAKNRMREQYGGAYILVTPTTLTCNVSDASVVSQVCKARRSFPKPLHQYAGLDLFGANIVASEYQDWAHHRRHTAPTFNEKNNALVWHEAIRLSTEMLEHWKEEYSRDISHSDFIVDNAREDILKLTLNIICSAGFGVTLPFKGALEASTKDTQQLFRDAIAPPPGYHFTFRSVMEYLNQNITTVFLANAILPRWVPRVLVPFLQSGFDAYDDLEKYFQALIASAEWQKSSAHNLLGELVRARSSSGTHTVAADISSTNDRGLSDSEIQGNMFIFMIAGHETTATTLRFTLVILALHQDVQDWLVDGIHDATRDAPNSPEEWDYSSLFPKLVAPLCVMLETLRLYPPVVTIPKWTADSAVDITYEDQTFSLPPSVSVNLNATGLHYSQEYWGPDAEVYDPSRWDKRNRASFLAQYDDAEGLSGPGLEHSSIHKPVRGAFIPFSDGNRACVGKKFAQVEFTVALTVIFRDYRVELAKTKEDETEEDARQRARQVLQESSSKLTLAMTGEVPLRFTKRSEGPAW